MTVMIFRIRPGAFRTIGTKLQVHQGARLAGSIQGAAARQKR